MFNISTLKSELIGMIGLRDSDNPELPVSTLTGTTQSVYFDDYHPLITYDNLYYIAPNYDGLNYTTWTATGYATGAYAMYDNVAYKAQRTMATGDTPSLTSTAWQTPVKDWILEKQNAAINKLCNQVFTNKKLRESTKTLLDDMPVVDGAGRIEDTITGNSRFVGYEIELMRINNIKMVLNYIGLQLTTSQTLTVYLFHSSQKAAVATWSLTNATANSFDWLSATSPATGSNELNYVLYSGDIDSGGTYYLGYFEDDLTGSAIEKRPSCGCSGYSVFKWSKWAMIRPIEVVSAGLDGTNIFDVDRIGYSDTNYGLNFSFAIKTDLTELLVNNKTIFTNALGYQFASDIIKSAIFNSDSRTNKRLDTSHRNAVLYEWSADPENQETIRQQLKDASEALGFDLSRISQALPNQEGRRTLKMGAV